MVVTTKQPKPSIPVVPSRTGSATATPKAAKRANLNVQPATSIPSRSLQEDQPIPGAARIPTTTPSLSSKHETSGPFSDNARFLPSPKKSTKRLVKRMPAKRPSKAFKKKKARRWSELIDLLTKITFLLFSIYSLLVCPRDVELQSPVCRGLDHYRRTIVDPYILPPLRAAATHPVIAPQIERARPYVEQTVEAVKTRYHAISDKAAIAAEPYILMARREYILQLRPRFRLMAYNIYRYQRMARPYVNLAKRTTRGVWVRFEPYVTPILVELEQVFALLRTFVQRPLEQGKVKWVDPQIKKIVDKVHEMGVAATPATEEPVAATAPFSEDTLSTLKTISTPVATTFYSSPTSEPTTETATTTTTTTTTETSSTEPTPTVDPLDIPIHNPHYDEDVEDLEFWEEFDKWLSESILPPDTETTTTTTTTTRPAPTRLTAEEKAEKKRIEKEETAAKRKDIMARHDKWEQELEALIETEVQGVTEHLQTVRAKAAKELASQAALQEQLKGMRDEMANAVEYTRIPLQKFREEWEDRYGDFDENFDDKVPAWGGILESLERNFARRVEAVNQILSKWVPKWIDEEIERVKVASERITELTEKAQADLISDYAWLGDVTYRDWERYHKLMFRGREVQEQLQNLQRGTLETSPPNPVHQKLANIKEEIAKLQEMYNVGVDKIRKTGWRYIFGTALEDGEHTEEDEKDSEFVEVPKPQPPQDPKLNEETFAGSPIIGKSQEQVEQAMEAMGASHRGPHEEL